MPKNNIAILGANSHIAKGLIFNFLNRTDVDLLLFARSPEKVKFFLDTIGIPQNTERVKFFDFHEFLKHSYDVIINCIGFGDPNKLKNQGVEILYTIQKYDDFIIEYLQSNRSSLYINFSSGAAYLGNFSQPVDENSLTQICINKINEHDFYGIAKLYGETKHRSLGTYNIVDVRIFGYFSRFIDLESKFLLCEIIRFIKKDEIFMTDGNNILRDYISPDDLFNLLTLIIDIRKINDVFDIYALEPVSKFELLKYFNSNYKLKYEIRDQLNIKSETGFKMNYYSINKKAEKIGYFPKYDSIGCIDRELKELKFL